MKESDSGLIDVALIGLTNGTDKELTTNNIVSSNSLLTEAGIKYTQIMNSITDSIKSNIKASLTNINIFKSINIFKPTNPLIRKQELQNRINQLETKLKKLKEDYGKANTSKQLLGWFKSEKEQIKD